VGAVGYELLLEATRHALQRHVWNLGNQVGGRVARVAIPHPGVGSFAVQIAAAAGAHVIATTRTIEDSAYLRDLGAAEMVGPGDPYPRGVAGLVDLVHHPDGAEALHARVAPGGRVASATYTADVEALAANGITATNIISPGDRAVLGRLCDLVDQGKLRVPLSASFTLDDGPAALAAHAEHKRGKIGLSIQGSR
jgi:NADPH:quinone reductase-like Zn-dependent oxidoreductase